ncbi:MAG TPA: PDZ domain-containing protein [Thermomonas sp.]|nr:PDZ domain-containing protein [Thermomonas sp.]
MNRPTECKMLKPTVLALALALAGSAIAQTAPTPAQQQELAAARADLDKAAQRYAELAGKYGETGAPIRIEKRVLRKPVIGVLLAPDDAAGVRIAGVTPDSAAAAGGLKSGDRITGIDGKPLKAPGGAARVDEARELLSKLDAKTPVQLAFERDGKPQVVSLTPKVGDRLLVVPDGAMFDGDVRISTRQHGGIEIEAQRIEGAPAGSAQRIHIATADARGQADWAMIAPDVRTEIIRLGSDCKGEDCKLPLIAEAFRWSGLNLAAVDAQLGRYFGSSEGVLVLSTGKDLDGLQAGDVIQKIAGKPVKTPREAMEALRAQPAEAKVAVEYLRDRRNATAQVSVPKAMPFALPRVAAAPHAPGMPGAIEHRRMVFVGEGGTVQAVEHGAGPLPPAWAPKDGQQVGKHKVVMVDKDGKRSEWEGDAGDTPPAWVQAMPKDGKHVETRVQVIVDDKGNKTVLEDDELPPPAPPSPPKGD